MAEAPSPLAAHLHGMQCVHGQEEGPALTAVPVVLPLIQYEAIQIAMSLLDPQVALVGVLQDELLSRGLSFSAIVLHRVWIVRGVWLQRLCSDHDDGTCVGLAEARGQLTEECFEREAAKILLTLTVLIFHLVWQREGKKPTGTWDVLKLTEHWRAPLFHALEECHQLRLYHSLGPVNLRKVQRNQQWDLPKRWSSRPGDALLSDPSHDHFQHGLIHGIAFIFGLQRTVSPHERQKLEEIEGKVKAPADHLNLLEDITIHRTSEANEVCRKVGVRVCLRRRLSLLQHLRVMLCQMERWHQLANALLSHELQERRMCLVPVPRGKRPRPNS
mmetsp:Transcript_44705/g.106369  ORF Transcript_44705/g.106369 Transcript_44705/m.106369 type:complete len:330 (-) Transcript_44705:465-1454(-)